MSFIKTSIFKMDSKSSEEPMRCNSDSQGSEAKYLHHHFSVIKGPAAATGWSILVTFTFLHKANPPHAAQCSLYVKNNHCFQYKQKKSNIFRFTMFCGRHKVGSESSIKIWIYCTCTVRGQKAYGNDWIPVGDLLHWWRGQLLNAPSSFCMQ